MYIVLNIIFRGFSSIGDFSEANGGRAAAVSPPFTSPANSSALEIGRERWARAEKAAEKIICDVHPTSVSEQRRRDIIDYVQRLIGNSLGVEVIPYGSVPLKTYLPDGDIDLSAFGRENIEDLKHVVEGEEENRAGRFVIKDVQVINAEAWMDLMTWLN
ncbi:Hypothetical predicted protein [Olea europaea subsp. europaea]|uniref:Polymerase nucleotidyl transferase domain-containing protein n=1 Tax=Olea europaea subsp. europaea TaxID=158383 RepID=A0A8S0UL93_OLEEU|nr:Hypothetical predicted protein [Olea europaea subsp. europaea]